jgi:hypothetical protein
MGSPPTADHNHRVVIEIPGPLDEEKFRRFRDELQRIVSNYGATVLEQVKTKKKLKKGNKG